MILFIDFLVFAETIYVRASIYVKVRIPLPPCITNICVKHLHKCTYCSYKLFTGQMIYE